MKKGLKYCLILLVTIIGIIFINGCYYVFYGQEKSMKKLQQGKELNLYDCCSIYSMHMAVWMFGWTFIKPSKLAIKYSPNIDFIEITSPMIYPKYSRTMFDLGKFKIIIHEGLFRYLQDKDWLTKYIARYEVVNLKLPAVD